MLRVHGAVKQAAVDQLTHRFVQRLLGNPHQGTQITDARSRLVCDEKQDAVVNARKTPPRKDAIGLGDNGAKTKVQQGQSFV